MTIQTPISETLFPYAKTAAEMESWIRLFERELQQLKQKWTGFTNNPLANARLEIINAFLGEPQNE